MEVFFLNSKKKNLCFFLILIFTFNAIIIPSKIYASVNLICRPIALVLLNLILPMESNFSSPEEELA